MTAILYPVAETADAALHAPVGLAAREREAGEIAAGQVAFVTETAGPAFASREAALDAYAGRVDDERPGRIAVAMEARWCELRPTSPEVAQGRSPRRRAPLRPAFREGRRWPAPDPQALGRTVWRLSVSYWRIAAEPAQANAPSARRLRRDDAGRRLDGRELDDLARQPLRADIRQKPLDIGLFEVRLPEAPDVVMPDE